MRLVLVGNPNVGKSALFSRITGVHVIVSNYPGTTVEVARGRLRTADCEIEVVDLPGTYSIFSNCKAEDVTTKGLTELNSEDVVLNVLDSTNLERSLHLTLQLLMLRRPMLLALNFWDEAQHTGVHIDTAALEELLGVPCVPIVAISGERTKTLVERIGQAAVSRYEYDDQARWNTVGRIVERVQKLAPRRHTLGEALGDASLKPLSGAIIALLVLVLSAQLIWWMAEAMIRYIFDPFFSAVWSPLILKLSANLGEGWQHALLIGKLADGQVNYGEAFGLLTTGIYVPFAAVLPYVFSFYLVLSLWEDSGYLPRLAILLDRVMHGVGLHGMGLVPMLLGFGCNVPGTLASRIMESERERFICITLTAITVPCMAQAALIVGLAGRYGPTALVTIFGTLLIVWIALGVILNKTVKGESPEILMDVPPYRRPRLPIILKKVWMRLFWYLREAVPFVLGGVLLANLLYTFGIIAFAGKLAGPLLTGLMGLPEEAVGGLLMGFLRKDVAVGMLAPLNLSFRQTVVACVVLTIYFPCVATFVTMLKELGVTRLLLSVFIMISLALIVGGLLNVGLWCVVG